MEILQNLISDDSLAWEKSLDQNPDNFLMKLSTDSISELNEKKDIIQTCEIADFPILQNEILELKQRCLIHGNGFFILDGICFSNFTKEHIQEIFRLISISLLLNVLYTNVATSKLMALNLPFHRKSRF